MESVKKCFFEGEVVRLKSDGIKANYKKSGADKMFINRFIKKAGVIFALAVLCVVSLFAGCKMCFKHKYGDFVVITQATCTQSGLEQIACEKCGKVKEQRIIPAKGHNLVSESGKDADCVNSGYKPYERCTACDYSTFEEIPATGHDYSEWEYAKDNSGNLLQTTCVSDGLKERVCQNCGDRQTETEKAFDHDYSKVTTLAKAPTHYEDGCTEGRECARCGDVYSLSQTIRKLNYVVFYAETGGGEFSIDGKQPVATYSEKDGLTADDTAGGSDGGVKNLPENAFWKNYVYGNYAIYEESCGKTLKVVASAIDGYEFIGWFKGDKLVQKNGALTVTISEDFTEETVVYCARFSADGVVFAKRVDVWDGSVAEKFAQGGGTSGVPYLISSGAELKLLATMKDTKGKYFKLTHDIDLDGREWVPIGDYNGFCGVFDGAGHKITNGKFGVIHNNVGLFGMVGGNATIRRLGVENFTIDISTAKNLTVGGLVGASYGNIENCYAKGVIKVNYTDTDTNIRTTAGGLIGGAYGGSVQMCYSDADISVSTGVANKLVVGGLVGSLSVYAGQCVADGVIKVNRSSPIFAIGTVYGKIADGVGANNCFYSDRLKNSSSENVSVNGVEKAAAQLSSGAFYTTLPMKWDKKVWKLDYENGSLPTMREEARQTVEGDLYYIVRAVSGENGSVLPALTIAEHGAVVTIVAATDDKYSFAGWFADGETAKVCDSARYEFMAEKTVTLKAVFEKSAYVFNLSSDIDGYTPEEVTAGGATGGKYYPNEKAVAVAAEKDGYVFVGWFSSENGALDFYTADLRLEVEITDGDLYFVACYKKISALGVTAGKQGSGRAYIKIENDSGATEEKTTIENAVEGHGYTLVAEAAAGYRFFGWFIGNTLVSKNAEESFVMGSSPTVYIARFVAEDYNYMPDEFYILGKKYYFVTVGVKAETDGTAKGSAYLAKDDAGNKTTYAAVAGNTALYCDVETGYRVAYWTCDGEILTKGVDGLYEITKDGELLAVLEYPEYNIKLATSVDGADLSSSADKAFYNTDVTVYAKILENYAFVGWFCGEDLFAGVDVCTVENVYYACAFLMPADDITLTAVYKKIVALNVLSSDERAGTVSCDNAGDLFYGDAVTVSAAPLDGFAFFGWFDGDRVLSAKPDYTFAMPENDFTIVARFIKLKYPNDMWDGVSVAESYAAGSGTATDPYLISSGAELKLLAADGDTAGKYYRLVCDIDLNGKEWTPIGGTDGFYGVFDGAGHKIVNPKFVNYLTLYGLFGRVRENAVVRRLAVKNVFFSVSAANENHIYAGGIAAYLYGTIENCYVTGSAGLYIKNDNNSSPYVYYGGIAGLSEGENSMILCCYTDMKVSYSLDMGKNRVYIGGLVGYTNGGLQKCFATGAFIKWKSGGGMEINACYGYAKHASLVVKCYYSEKLTGSGCDVNGTGIADEKLYGAAFYEEYIGWLNSDWLVSRDDLSGSALPELFPVDAVKPEKDVYYQLLVYAEAGGIVNQTTAISDGTDEILLVATPDDGFVFDGWYIGETKISSDVEFNYAVIKSVIITAKFRAA